MVDRRACLRWLGGSKYTACNLAARRGRIAACRCFPVIETTPRAVANRASDRELMLETLRSTLSKPEG